ncbi:hypothetical protein Tco_0571700, partial [Tanacetum coccineum]
VSDISKRTKTKPKRTKPSTGLEEREKNEAEGVFIFNGPTPKGLKRQKEAKTIKNQQETGKRQRVKSKSENSARDHSRINPTQSKKETMKSKTQDKVKRAKNVKCSKIRSLCGVSKIQGPKLPIVKSCLVKKKRKKSTTRTEFAQLETPL